MPGASQTPSAAEIGNDEEGERPVALVGSVTRRHSTKPMM